MASRKPLVLNGGQIEQLQSGDTLNAAVTEVDVVARTNDEAGAIVIGAPVYVFDNDGVKKAQANASGTAKVLGLVTNSSVSAGASATIQTNGVLTATTTQWDAITGQSGGLTAGSYYFLDPSTSGKLTTTAPTSAGQLVVNVGLALSTTEMQINPEKPILL